MMHQNWLIKHWSTQGSVMSCCSVNGRYPRCPLMLHEWNWTNCSSGILVSVLKLNSLADYSIGRTVVRKDAVRVLQKSIVCGALQTTHLEYKMLEWGWLFDSQSKQKLYLTSVHNLVQVSCYGSCSGSHHEVKTLWGPAMVHQSPVCRLTPHLFLGKSYGVVGPGWGRWPWLIHGPNGYDYPLLTIHSICIANTEKAAVWS